MRSLLLLTVVMAPGLCAFQEPAPGQAGTAERVLSVIDAVGQEVPVKNWKFTVGTRRLAWLAPQAPAQKPKKGQVLPQGPEYLEFREDKSTTYQTGILTLVPLASIRKIDYDLDKKTVVATYVKADGKDDVLAGTTRYIGINKIVIEGDADLGKLGLASTKFKGGETKGGIRGLRFSKADSVAEPKGKIAAIVAADKEKTLHKVSDLTALYKTSNGNRLAPTLLFKKTVKIDLGQVQKLRHLPAEDPKKTSYDYEVTLADGMKLNLTLLEKGGELDNHPVLLVGLIGAVPAGYKLFPAHTIAELTFENK